MADENLTQPTIETVLQRIDALDKRMSGRLDNIEILLDRASSAAFEARADMREIRRALREQLNLQVG